MYDVNLCPVAALDPAEQLAPRERADTDHEGGMPNLFSQPDRTRAVELVGTVNGEAVGRASEQAGELSHLGGIGAEMRVDVVNASTAQPACNSARLDEIHPVVGQRLVRPLGHASGLSQGGPSEYGPFQHLSDDSSEQRHHALVQDETGLSALLTVRRVDQWAVPTAQSDPIDSDSLLFERKNFSPDEAVTYGGVVIDEVRDTHVAWPGALLRYLYSIRPVRRPMSLEAANLRAPAASENLPSTKKKAWTKRSFDCPLPRA